MFKKILFPVDHSEHSHQALAYVTAIAQKNQARVILLHAYPLLGSAIDVPLPAYTREFEELAHALRQSGQLLMDQYQAELEKAGIMSESISLQEDPRTAILQVAEQSPCDLIIMGTRGLGPVKSFLLESISKFVVHHARCPLLLVPAS